MFDFFVVEFEEKMVEIQQASNISDFDILRMVDSVKHSFKKSVVWNSKQSAKDVPMRLKEVIIIIIYLKLNCDDKI